MSQSQQSAAGSMVDLVAARIGNGRAVHPETAIACTARIAGSLLLRSFSLKLEDFPPGSVLLSEEANVQGPQLIGILGSALQSRGVTLDKTKLGGTDSLRGQTPKFTLMESLDLLQDDALRIARDCGLSLAEAAQAAAVATAFVVSECARDIGGEVGFNVAVYSFIEGCKTVPPLLKSDALPTKEKKPWYKPW
jgi:hypothetical protein